MIVLTPGSDAYETLKSMLNHASTYKVRIQVQPTTNGHRVSLKQNEGMWTAPLDVGFEPHDVYDKPTVLQFPGMPPVTGTGPVVTEQLAPETCIYRGQPGFSRCNGPVTRDPGGDPACASHQRIVHPKA